MKQLQQYLLGPCLATRAATRRLLMASDESWYLFMGGFLKTSPHASEAFRAKGALRLQYILQLLQHLGTPNCPYGVVRQVLFEEETRLVSYKAPVGLPVFIQQVGVWQKNPNILEPIYAKWHPHTIISALDEIEPRCSPIICPENLCLSSQVFALTENLGTRA